VSAHTKGPWMALPDNPKVEAWWHVSDGEDFICQMFSKHGEFDNAKANARLIAAAPDLLEALQYVMSAHGEQLTDAFDQAHKAIAKATGETK